MVGVGLGPGVLVLVGVRVAVRVLPAGTLPRSEVGKAVRVARWGPEAPRRVVESIIGDGKGEGKEEAVRFLRKAGRSTGLL